MRIDRVLISLAHLSAILSIHKSVAVNGLGQRDVGGLKHAGPDHAVEPDNILADQVAIGGPEGRQGIPRGGEEVDAGDVVGQGVEPDIHDMSLVEPLRNPDTPLKSSARNGQIPESIGLQASQDTVSVHVRLDKPRVFLNVLDQPVAVLAHAEEVGLLFDALQGVLAVHEVHGLGFSVRDEGLLSLVVPALVLVEVDVSPVRTSLP
jgi:hypothetical protein